MMNLASVQHRVCIDGIATVLLIPCPWCGARHENEFTYGGDASIAAPGENLQENAFAWYDFVYERDNPSGEREELWHHTFGCGKWIRLKRDTRNNRFLPEAKPES